MTLHCPCGKGYVEFITPLDGSERQISGIPALSDFRDVHISTSTIHCSACNQTMYNWDIDDLEMFGIALEKEHGPLLKNH